MTGNTKKEARHDDKRPEKRVFVVSRLKEMPRDGAGGVKQEGAEIRKRYQPLIVLPSCPSPDTAPRLPQTSAGKRAPPAAPRTSGDTSSGPTRGVPRSASRAAACLESRRSAVSSMVSQRVCWIARRP